MARKNAAEHQEIIRQLFDADRQAGERIEEARKQADEMIADARRQADETVEKARTDADSEAEAIVRDAEEKATRSGQTAGTADHIHAMRRQARENMDRAVDYLVDWVIAGKGF